MNGKKLYTLSRQNHTLPYYTDFNKNIIFRSAHNIPMMTWPDKTWCLPANIFMLESYERNLSRKDGGGTLHTYATHISHFLRYCFYNKIQIHSITDSEFTLFIKTLSSMDSSNGRPPRNSNTIIAIGRTCLSLIESVSRLFKDDQLIGKEGRIRAERKEIITYKKRNISDYIVRKYWHHHSFPTASTKNRRLPVTSLQIDGLRNSIQEVSKSFFLRKRRYVMLKLLEITGGRRSEISEIKVKSIYDAMDMQEPALKIPSAKSRNREGNFRYVPICQNDLLFLKEYIEKNRSITLKKINKPDVEGYLLINEKTGTKLRPNTITQEISLLKKASQIKEKICPHMFRHRYITKLFVALFEQHQINNQDEFRKALLDTQHIKQKIQQATGHKKLESLDVYINLAFDEITDFKKTLDIIRIKHSTESFQQNLAHLSEELRAGEPITDIIKRLENITAVFRLDLES